MFSADGPRVTAYMNLSRLFPRHELPRLAQEALAASPAGVSTKAIAAHVIAAKGLDGQDRHLRKAISYKAVQIMRRMERQRKVSRAGKGWDRGGVEFIHSNEIERTDRAVLSTV